MIQTRLCFDVYIRKYFIMISLFLINFILVIAIEDYVFGDTSEDIIKKGKLQYQILQDKGRMPQYGECWKAAINNLHDGCRSLSEETQADVALRFTNCFLEMSGHETYNCDLDKKPNLRRICINSMTDRAFSVYTEFYTHSQNMCFFLRNQVWHEETEKTIDRLSSNSAHVTLQLEEAGHKTESILKQQEESISMQEKLLNYGDTLTKTIETSQQTISNILDQVHSSAMEQKRIFERLSALQAWMIGEVSWLDTLIFYITSVIVITLITSSKRTSDGRVSCYLLLTCHACVERYICTLILDTHKYEALAYINELLLYSVWWLRRLTIGVIFIVYLYTAYNYNDYNKLNHELLICLKDQNEFIQKILESLNNKDLNSVEDKTNSDKSELNVSNESSLARNFYQNVDKIDNIRRRISCSIYSDDDSFDAQDNFDDLNKARHYKSVSTSDKNRLNNLLDNKYKYQSDISKKYNLRSNSRQATPDNNL